MVLVVHISTGVDCNSGDGLVGAIEAQGAIAVGQAGWSPKLDRGIGEGVTGAQGEVATVAYGEGAKGIACHIELVVVTKETQCARPDRNRGIIDDEGGICWQIFIGWAGDPTRESDIAWTIKVPEIEIVI